jgi:hypothetical protein
MKYKEMKSALKGVYESIWMLFFLLIFISAIISVIFYVYIDEHFERKVIEEPKEELTYHYKYYIPSEQGNYTLSNDVIRTPSGRLIKCEELK